MLDVAVKWYGAVDDFWQAYNAVSTVTGFWDQAKCRACLATA